jgi:hypothetical protein
MEQIYQGWLNQESSIKNLFQRDLKPIIDDAVNTWSRLLTAAVLLVKSPHHCGILDFITVLRTEPSPHPRALSL